LAIVIAIERTLPEHWCRNAAKRLSKTIFLFVVICLSVPQEIKFADHAAV
jgi:hypothetical protein